MSDDDLLSRLRDGDDAAFGALVDRHRSWLVRQCARHLRDAHAAEDAAQESLLRLHAAARRDDRPLRIRPWLTVVARRVCVDQQRKRRPDLPGVLPERAAPLDDPLALDSALAEAWPRLSGRHREVLYLREVLDFSYKEIGSVMGLSMPATETLVFRARASLRREYERAGGSAFGCGLLGFHLARLGFGRPRDAGVADGITSAAAADPGLGNLTARLAQFVTSLPGCGEQTVAKVLSVAAGAAMAVATVVPGLAPFGDTPAAVAAAPPAASEPVGAAPVSAAPAAAGTGAVSASPPTGALSLKSLLSNVVPADWAPKGSRSEPAPPAAQPPAATGSTTGSHRMTPLRDAAAAMRTGDGPTLRGPTRTYSDPGPLRSMLPAPPVGPSGEPAHPIRALLADPVPQLLDPLPDPPATLTPAAGELPVSPRPAPEDHPAVKEVLQPARDAVATLGAHEPALLRRKDG